MESDELPMLNDDCLLTIFSFLPLPDLLQVRKCCRRFKALADDAASKKCRKEEFHYNYKLKIHEETMKCYGGLMQNVIFECCGRGRETGLLVQPRSVRSKVKWMWLRHCTALKSLTIRKKRVYYDRYSAKIYENLENLEFYQCFGDEDKLKRVIEACKNLKTISVNMCEFTCNPLKYVTTLENVEKISFRRSGLENNNCLPYILDKLQDVEKLKCFEIDLYCQCRGHENYMSEFAKAMNKQKSIKLCQIHLVKCRNFRSEYQRFCSALKEFEVTINPTPGRRHHYDMKLQWKN